MNAPPEQENFSIISTKELEKNLNKKGAFVAKVPFLVDQ